MSANKVFLEGMSISLASVGLVRIDPRLDEAFRHAVHPRRVAVRKNRALVSQRIARVDRPRTRPFVPRLLVPAEVAERRREQDAGDVRIGPQNDAAPEHSFRLFVVAEKIRPSKGGIRPDHVLSASTTRPPPLRNERPTNRATFRAPSCPHPPQPASSPRPSTPSPP